jgi:WD40 repeat protein
MRSKSLGSSTAGQASEILYDAYRMLLAYYTPIFSHALHVYESAVPTMPKCALFATVNADTAAGARLLSARQAGWTATLRVIETHAGEVNSVAFSPDGTHIVSGSRDTTVRLWSASVGDPLAIFIGHAGSVKCVAFSPNGTKIASGSVDCTVRLWDARTHKELAILHTLGKVTRSVSFSPNGSLIAITLDSHKSVCVWNPAAEEHVFVLEGHEDRVAAVFSPDGSRIIFASDTGIVRVWNSRTDLREVAMQGHDSAVTSVSFSPDKDWFVSAAKTQVRVGNMRTRKIACVSQGHFLDKVKSLALSPNGQRVVLGFADATVHVWGETSGVLQGHLSRVESVAISPDGTQIASGSADETIRVWDIRAGSAFTYQDNSNASPSHELVISPTGSHLVSIVANFGRVWDMQTYEQIATLEGHASIILLVTFSLNGAHIITGSSDKTVRVWDTRTGVQLAVMNCDPETVSAVAISPDGTQVVSGSTTNGKLRVWDVLTAKKVAIFVGHESQVQAVVFSPDGVWIASGSDDNTARVWDIQRRKQHRVFKGHQSSVSSVAFSPDGSRLVSGSRDKTIRVWDINMRVQIGLVVHDRWRPVVGFTSNGDRICTRNGRGIELVWDFQDMSTRYQRDPERNVRVSACATPSTTDNMSEADAGHKENYNENAIAWNGKTGWLSCTTNTSGLLPLCWLPAGNRGPVIIRGWVAAVSGLGGKVTVLDFTDTIERLQSLGIM